MKSFIGEDFLLNTQTARELYHNYAAKQKIIDYHCHINPADIAADRTYNDIAEVWLGGDHYKWRLMRAAGVDESYITGAAAGFDKFKMYAKVLSKAAGNPLYHWSHMELKRYFGYDGILNEETAASVWDICNKKLKTDLSAKSIIKSSNVEALCTTDDPADSLEYHEEIAKDATFGVKVLPAWRPDNALNIEKEGFLDYLDVLSKADGDAPVEDLDSLCHTLKNRMDYFNGRGCKTADHGLYYVPCQLVDIDVARGIFAKRKRGEELTWQEIQQYKTVLMLFLGRAYEKLGWVMQLHFGCKRNNNTPMFKALGADTGYDCVSNHFPSYDLAEFLDVLANAGGLPKTVLYSLNPTDNAVISTIAGCFRDVQHGSAWWFNDHKKGMSEHMENLAATGYLAGFIGMLTDSRSLISYPRHEYFRRILCDFLGNLAENGEFPNDIETLGEIVCDISYNNVKGYFGF